MEDQWLTEKQVFESKAGGYSTEVEQISKTSEKISYHWTNYTKLIVQTCRRYGAENSFISGLLPTNVLQQMSLEK